MKTSQTQSEHFQLLHSNAKYITTIPEYCYHSFSQILLENLEFIQNYLS